jgi:hypothetical protein
VTTVVAVLSTRDTQGGGQSPDELADGEEPAPDIDPCLLGTWTMTSSVRTWNVAGSAVQMSSDSASIRYFRPDGTALLDFRDGQRETGTSAGLQYEALVTGTIGFRYRTSGGDTIFGSDPQVDGELVISLNGLELTREPLVAVTEPLQYACAEDSLAVYEPTGVAEFTRTSTDWDQ